jgi:hypothetical protein
MLTNLARRHGLVSAVRVGLQSLSALVRYWCWVL